VPPEALRVDQVMKSAFARAALIFVVVHAIAAFFFLLLGVG
jgi:hypothetical protein